MISQIMHEVLRLIEAEAESQPRAIEFEMAYQARVAIDRIRFAIKHTEQFCPRSNPLREAGLQLLDALERLEAVDRRFQQHARANCPHSERIFQTPFVPEFPVELTEASEESKP